MSSLDNISKSLPVISVPSWKTTRIFTWPVNPQLCKLLLNTSNPTAQSIRQQHLSVAPLHCFLNLLPSHPPPPIPALQHFLLTQATPIPSGLRNCNMCPGNSLCFHSLHQRTLVCTEVRPDWSRVHEDQPTHSPAQIPRCGLIRSESEPDWTPRKWLHISPSFDSEFSPQCCLWTEDFLARLYFLEITYQHLLIIASSRRTEPWRRILPSRPSFVSIETMLQQSTCS